MAYRNQADWQKLIEEQQHSGLSQQAFCEARGINPKYFSMRKTKLQAKADEVGVAARFVKARQPALASTARVHYQGLTIEFAGSVAELAALAKHLA